MQIVMWNHDQFYEEFLPAEVGITAAFGLDVTVIELILAAEQVAYPAGPEVFAASNFAGTLSAKPVANMDGIEYDVLEGDLPCRLTQAARPLTRIDGTPLIRDNRQVTGGPTPFGDFAGDQVIVRGVPVVSAFYPKDLSRRKWQQLVVGIPKIVATIRSIHQVRGEQGPRLTPVPRTGRSYADPFILSVDVEATVAE